MFLCVFCFRLIVVYLLLFYTLSILRKMFQKFFYNSFGTVFFARCSLNFQPGQVNVLLRDWRGSKSDQTFYPSSFIKMHIDRSMSYPSQSRQNRNKESYFALTLLKFGVHRDLCKLCHIRFKWVFLTFTKIWNHKKNIICRSSTIASDWPRRRRRRRRRRRWSNLG